MDSKESPFCFACGYDLVGVELSESCPECGEPTNPAVQFEKVRQWFGTRHFWIWWTRLSSNLPPGVWYTPGDRFTGQRARRRFGLGIALPLFLSSTLILLGSAVTLKYKVRVWYYATADPAQKPLREVFETEEDHLFDLNLHLFSHDFLYPEPSNWTKASERQLAEVEFSLPPRPRFIAIPLLVLPWAVMAMSVVPCWLWGMISRFRPQGSAIRLAGISLLGAPLVFFLWSWFGFTAIVAIALIGNDVISPEWLASLQPLAPWCGLPPVLTFFLLSLVALPRLVGCDRPGRVFKAPFIAKLILASLSLFGPILIAWLLFWLLN